MTLREKLDKVEARIFGVLVEKELTTPEQYPLSLNALVNGCNQKSNRDPVVSFDEQTVNEALLRLRLHHLVREVHAAGARVVKYAHAGGEVLEVSPAELAVLVELLLRGAQTSGELRTRASRMTPLPELGAMDALLAGLVQRGMVQRLSPGPGSRSPRWAETLSLGAHPVEADARAGGGTAPATGAGARSAAAPSAAASPGLFPEATSTASAKHPGAGSGDSRAPAAELASLTRRIEALEATVRALAERLEAQGHSASLTHPAARNPGTNG